MPSTDYEGNVDFRSLLRSGPPPIGTIVSVSSTEVAEVLVASGFDWLFIDLEHGALDVGDAQRLLQAASGSTPSLIRIPENSDVWIKKTLDLGCDGVIVPQVNTAEQARAVVASAKYPPLGRRSVGVGRAQGYGLAFKEYIDSANDATTIVVQIESIAAVEAIDSILAVEGVDAVFVGPYDLSGSLNRLGDVDHADVQGAIVEVLRACKSRGVPVGVFAMTALTGRGMLEQGFDFLAVGIDMPLLASAAKSALSDLRGGSRDV